MWWPEDGSGIKDLNCRKAFQTVMNKNSGQRDTAYVQFVQKHEYAVLIPNYQAGLEALKKAVPTDICSAGAVKSSAQFGDKSGMSVPSNWTTTLISGGNGDYKTIYFVWRATATHNPSYWDFFVTKPTFDYRTTVMTWNVLDHFHTVSNIMPGNGDYSIKLNLPARFNPATLVVRWQRIDSVGEAFINCGDYKFIKE
eukprot:gene14384-16973_t